MKIKVYRYSLLISLLLILGLNIFFIVLASLNLANGDELSLFDNIMYIVCLVLSFAFIALQIYNTIHSFKTGSNFIKDLCYNEGQTLNDRFLKLLVLFAIIVFAIFIYSLLIYLDVNIPLINLDKPIKSIMLTFSLILEIDAIFILLYPIVSKVDVPSKK